MKILVRVALLIVLLALGFWLWTVFFPSPEKVIRRRLAELAQSASFQANEGPLATAINVEKLSGFFAAEVGINIDVPGRSRESMASRDEIMHAAAGARPVLNSLTVQFYDITVKVSPDKQSATAELTMKAATSADRDYAVQEMRITLKKIKREWLINRVETVRTLMQRPTGDHLQLMPSA